jgi:hypothetical protein
VAGARETGGAEAAAPVPEQTFGRLEPVRIRDYWRDEARDFTPWLAQEENLALLGETIDLNLELVGIERRVGPFKADIVARDEDHQVVIENQLDATDHKHLGQLLVYAAGRDARTVVWVAKRVTDEYRKVIDWLNQETSTNFWALEIELWRIEGSLVAPKFNVVCEPNELTKSTDEASEELSGTRLSQLEFWKGFSEYLDQSGASFNSRKASPKNWYALSIGTARGFLSCSVVMSTSGRLGCELYLPGAGADAVFAALLEEKEVIEAELGELDWQDLPDRKACRIADYNQPVDAEDREQWPELFAWLRDRAEAFKATLAHRVKDVELPEPQATSAAALPRDEIGSAPTAAANDNATES